MGGSVFSDLRSWTNAGRPAPSSCFGVGDDLADARAHAGVVARDQIFHVRRRRHLRRWSLQRGARLREIDDDGILEDDADKRSAVLIEGAQLERLACLARTQSGMPATNTAVAAMALTSLVMTSPQSFRKLANGFCASIRRIGT